MLATTVPWFVDAEGPSGAAAVGVVVGGLVLLVAGPAIGVQLGHLVLVLADVVRRRRGRARGLRARGTAGVMPVHGDVVVLDPFDRHELGGVDRVTLRPFDVPRRRWRRGVVLSASGRSPLVVPGRFDAAEVAELCRRCGIEQGRPYTKTESLPPLVRPLRRNLLRYGGRTVRAVPGWWLWLSWLPVALAAAGLAAVVLATLGTTGRAVPLAVSGAGAVLTVVLGWAVARGQTIEEYRDPDAVPEPAPVR